MGESFEPVPDEHDVLRLATPQGGFLPEGRVLPLPDWLVPSSRDREEAARRGRTPGLSAWDLERCTPDEARLLADRPNDRAFVACAGDLRARARTVLPEGHVVDIVRDELEAANPRAGWDAHVLIEGLERPQGVPNAKSIWRELREQLVACFRSEAA